ncbi:DNA polymerase III subunit chi [Simiduia agarivorans]|uniref:DNA polymerase III subunit chi n=1 Tax=Simiduia agarivorans (strain DSM 21679 / JCM 13881 / BCRC 17597 / SA1) TaxID=1117647 RepID=K4KJY7_SIMAS|nr:DNA polymerase III subunit chi [Simiduia agarivorans]AFU98338.1 DNA polymerase III subunit chi [Simiduia agarivorans SA1 = DSM 21679]
MTRIDFLAVNDASPEARLHLAARLTQRALREGRRILIACTDAGQQATLDSLLWTFEPESFIPHATDIADPQSPVTLCTGEECGDHHDVLINLQSPAPAFFSRFERLFEVICQDPSILSSTRANWAYYKSRGYPLDYKTV